MNLNGACRPTARRWRHIWTAVLPRTCRRSGFLRPCATACSAAASASAACWCWSSAACAAATGTRRCRLQRRWRWYDDDFRRGKPTNHRVYGEAMAVLAGDALLTAAFETASGAEADAQTIVRVVKMLSTCAGELGMVGGQVLDLAAEQEAPDAEHIYTLQSLKTGALIRAACCCGVLAGHGSEAQLEAAAQYAAALGLAFQIRDDMLDVLGDAEKLGKAVHVDANKGTFVRLYGLERCEGMISEQGAKAHAALNAFNDHSFLGQLIDVLAVRDH